MSNAIFPTLPGLTWSIVKTPTWKTGMQQSVNGQELRRAYRPVPIWTFSLSYEFLRGGNGRSELQQLVAFYNLRKGAFDSFLFKDASDNAAVAQQFAVGDGVTKSFALLHSIGGWVEPVGFATGVSVSVNGVAMASPSQFSANDGVNVVFVAAPVAGAILTWSGSFYYRVRFSRDEMEFEQFMRDLWAQKKCELTGVI